MFQGGLTEIRGASSLGTHFCFRPERRKHCPLFEELFWVTAPKSPEPSVLGCYVCDLGFCLFCSLSGTGQKLFDSNENKQSVCLLALSCFVGL